MSATLTNYILYNYRTELKFYNYMDKPTVQIRTKTKKQEDTKLQVLENIRKT